MLSAPPPQAVERNFVAEESKDRVDASVQLQHMDAKFQTAALQTDTSAQFQLINDAGVQATPSVKCV